jgi:2-iminoacetate synthase
MNAPGTDAMIGVLDRAAILGWLREDDPSALETLWRAADRVRRIHVGEQVHLRGLIEISNHCARECAYCGIRAANSVLPRYRMTPGEILEAARMAARLGYGTVVLQSGEDPGLPPGLISDLVRRIKKETPLAVTLSLGERSEADLAAWREAGADRYLLRFETSNRELFRRIHPAPRGGEERDRIAILRSLRALGYEIGSGVMIGIPGATWDDLANDIETFAALDLDMIGVGPYIPHPQTPLGGEAPPSATTGAPAAAPREEQVPAAEDVTYRVIALARLVCPSANIPSTTALATLNRANGRELGLQRGANVVMPNLTPAAYRALYEIYPAKACVSETAELCNGCLQGRLAAIGRPAGTGRGDSPRIRRTKGTRARSEAIDFVDDDRIESLLRGPRPDEGRIGEILAKSLAKEPLTEEETATLLLAEDPDSIERIFETARTLKQQVYGNRIVLFAPLYVGNECVNDCAYCGFRNSNREAVRRTLDDAALAGQVRALEGVGHKRLILVFGEHPRYDERFIADCVRTVYATRSPGGEIRRVNINAAPLDHDGFRTVKEAGIGTYQIFQETYHHATYERVHPRRTRKGDYLYRLDGPARAIEAGCDDVGIGALFGLHPDFRFEVTALVAHGRRLLARYGIGPHTISFPRLRPATGVGRETTSPRIADADFLRLIAILRLAVPYTGLILTARESAEVRRSAMGFGVSQIDAGSRIEIGGYTESGDSQCMEREQFLLDDIRSLDEVVRDLAASGYIPSFCTACYRLGRTGERFMEYAIPGFIRQLCTPNALTTLMEYTVDHASKETRAVASDLIRKELAGIEEPRLREEIESRMRRIETSDERDLHF